MPNIGDICHGRDLGITTKYSHNRKYIFVKCLECSSERWIIKRRERITSDNPYVTCHFCTFKKTRKLGHLNQGKRELAPRWKGGRSDTLSRKYIYLRIYNDDPFFCMATHCKKGGGEILEHRLIMARHLNRVLTHQEHVHHINGDKKDNRIENLELVSPANHMLYDKICSHCLVRVENRKLKREIKRLTAQLTPML